MSEVESYSKIRNQPQSEKTLTPAQCKSRLDPEFGGTSGEVADDWADPRNVWPPAGAPIPYGRSHPASDGAIAYGELPAYLSDRASEDSHQAEFRYW
jgi:hypothetical protein